VGAGSRERCPLAGADLGFPRTFSRICPAVLLIVFPFPVAGDLPSSPAGRGPVEVGHACVAGSGALDPHVASCRIVGWRGGAPDCGRLAELAGLTVRTLHHYDEIGLVCPSARTAAGYRAYSAGDVERLREVLAYRRLGFGLQEVADLVSDPSADAVAHLRRLRGLLLEERDWADAMVTAIDRELTARAKGTAVTPEKQLGTRLYDAIGGAYPATRRTDPRIAAQVWDALGDARTVLNGRGRHWLLRTARPRRHRAAGEEISVSAIARRAGVDRTLLCWHRDLLGASPRARAPALPVPRRASLARIRARPARRHHPAQAAGHPAHRAQPAARRRPRRTGPGPSHRPGSQP
jgi:DNA-binding transcriptional MerR regulator